MGKITRAISRDGAIAVMAIDSRDIVAEIERINGSSAVITAALGRLATAASMMGSNLKGENETITLRIDGGGPAGMLIAVAGSKGNVKAYVTNPIVELPLSDKNKLDVSGAVGKDGSLTVIKDLKLKEPQIGQVELISGEIAEDITYYFAQSEQIPTACALGVLVNPDLTVRTAGGFLTQLLPGAEDFHIDILEANIAKLGLITDMLDKSKTTLDICKAVFGELEFDILSEFEVSYQCDCSRERTEKALISLGKAELTNLMEEDKGVDVLCDFCKTNYHFTEDDLKELIDKSTKG